MIPRLRKVARQWYDKHSDAIAWDGMMFKDLSVMMSGIPGRTFVDQVEAVSKDREWIA